MCGLRVTRIQQAEKQGSRVKEALTTRRKKDSILEMKNMFIQCPKWDPEVRDFVASNSLTLSETDQ